MFSKLNDLDNALIGLIHSFKLDPTDPITSLNLAILQKNANFSQIRIDKPLEQNHQCYAQPNPLTTSWEFDSSMLDIAAQLRRLLSTETVLLPGNPVHENAKISSARDS